jgi:hypothetical protein
MARIRTIKPEFPQSESMGRVSREARLCFVLLWTLADDAGRLRGNSRMLASLLYPYDDDAPSLISGWLDELEQEHCIQRYSINEDSYLEICNWLTHQKIDRPSKSKTPEPIESSREIASPRENSLRTKDQGPRKGERETRASNFDVTAIELPEWLDPKVWGRWAADRKERRKPITARAAEAQIKQLTEYRDQGHAPESVIEYSIAGGYQGLFAPNKQRKAEEPPLYRREGVM